jgi:hypothetical protein
VAVEELGTGAELTEEEPGWTVAGRGMPSWRHPGWMKVDDAELAGAHRLSTSLVNVAGSVQRGGATGRRSSMACRRSGCMAQGGG